MALFVALTLPPPVVKDLQAAVAAVRAGMDDVAGLRWTRPEQWHLTLAFLGEVEPDRVAELRARLARTATRHGGLPLAIRGAGAFSRPAAARVVWAGVDGDPEGLSRLADSVGAAARRCGIAVESRRFRPHLTLARLGAPTDVRPLVAALAPYVGPSWTTDAVHLIRSHLGGGPDGRGSAYETLATWPLRG